MVRFVKYPAALALLLLLADSGSASVLVVAPEGIEATAVCAPSEGPGKVRCDVGVAVLAGRLRFADVTVQEAPEFAPALRSRLGPADATRRDENGASFALALVAKSTGVGNLRVMARAVVCDRRGCLPYAKEATTYVKVGRPELPAPQHQGS